MCQVEVSYNGGSTGTMLNHLKHVHKSLNVETGQSKPVNTSHNQLEQVQSRITDFNKVPVVNINLVYPSQQTTGQQSSQ